MFGLREYIRLNHYQYMAAYSFSVTSFKTILVFLLIFAIAPWIVKYYFVYVNNVVGLP